MKLFIGSAAAVAALAITAPVANAQIAVGIYQLCNHPNGSATPPSYGLRLDELFDVSPDHDVFTFDFEDVDNGSDVKLFFDGNSIRITGQAFGGNDIGGQYDPASPLTGVYSFDFIYNVGVQTAPGDDDLIVNAGVNGANFGSITAPDNTTIDLFDRVLGDFSFRFGDNDDGLGYRGAPGLNGWGWFDQGAVGNHVRDSDWLFTAKFIGVPAPAPLAIAGLGGLLIAQRRRQTA
ncbi:MAG: hypothetical protein AAGK04_10705 [Planctomycetota bacterium]